MASWQDGGVGPQKASSPSAAASGKLAARTRGGDRTATSAGTLSIDSSVIASASNPGRDSGLQATFELLQIAEVGSRHSSTADLSFLAGGQDRHDGLANQVEKLLISSGPEGGVGE
jgi:hypothetical protein